MTEAGLMTRLRFKQIRLFAKTVERISSRNGSNRLLSILGSNPLIDRALSGFRRTYPSFEAACRAAERYKLPSHEHPNNIAIHLARAEELRPSDYPVLFHLQKILPQIRSVLDIGGSIGNLFFSYEKYLDYPPGFSWTVFEASDLVTAGTRIAQQKNEPRLQFTTSLESCESADAVLISGALHYFEQMPPELLQGLRHRPRHVFINRTPVIDGPSAVTIQDHDDYYAISPARMISRSELMQSMSVADYDLVDEWRASELRLRIPLHPKASVNAYSGFYFRAQESQAQSSQAPK